MIHKKNHQLVLVWTQPVAGKTERKLVSPVLLQHVEFPPASCIDQGGEKGTPRTLKLGGLPSGYVKIAIENGHL